MDELIVIGGGLAGCEAAYQAAQRGIFVKLFEMRPNQTTGAHNTADLAELVCSNSLGSTIFEKAGGLLKEELRRLGSLLLRCAELSAIPAGSALAVDRFHFSRLVTQIISNHPNIQVIREEITKIPSTPTIIASGPLTSPGLSEAIQSLTGNDNLFFFDAISPIVSGDTINFQIAFWGNRYSKDNSVDGDYINCPMTQDEYQTFVSELITAERIPLQPFENHIRSGVRAGIGKYFEGCLPVEIIAERGLQSLAFGPMRPTGLRDPRNGKRPYAVVQLRQDNFSKTLFNIVGFQTNLLYSEQKRVFRMIPGLENAEFLRYGQIHRNTYVASPLVLNQFLEIKNREALFFAGQLTGVEGYVGNIATGLMAGINAARRIKGQPLIILPETTIIGALIKYVSSAEISIFQPMKANFGILPSIEETIPSKQLRGKFLADRAINALNEVIQGEKDLCLSIDL